MIVAVDPGVNFCGAALFTEAGELCFAWLEENGPRAIHARVKRAYGATSAIVEVPQVYARSASKGDPNDLIDVALVAGGVVALFDPVRVVRPREWKGDAPKEVVERCARAAIGFQIDRVEQHKRAALMHNVWDAIAIGLFATRGSWRPRAN